MVHQPEERLAYVTIQTLTSNPFPHLFRLAHRPIAQTAKMTIVDHAIIRVLVTRPKPNHPSFGEEACPQVPVHPVPSTGCGIHITPLFHDDGEMLIRNWDHEFIESGEDCPKHIPATQ